MCVYIGLGQSDLLPLTTDTDRQHSVRLICGLRRDVMMPIEIRSYQIQDLQYVSLLTRVLLSGLQIFLKKEKRLPGFFHKSGMKRLSRPAVLRVLWIL